MWIVVVVVLYGWVGLVLGWFWFGFYWWCVLFFVVDEGYFDLLSLEKLVFLLVFRFCIGCFSVWVIVWMCVVCSFCVGRFGNWGWLRLSCLGFGYLVCVNRLIVWYVVGCSLMLLWRFCVVVCVWLGCCLFGVLVRSVGGYWVCVWFGLVCGWVDWMFYI